EFRMNTFGRDYVYVVPEKLREKTGFDEFVVSAKAPGQDEVSDFYVSLTGEGHLSLLSALDIDGEFAIVFTEDSARLEIGGIIDMPLFEPIGVTGTLGFEDGGLYGALQPGHPSGSTL